MDAMQRLLGTCQSMMAFIVKFNSVTAGRDKLCRFSQYGSKLAGHIMTQNGFDKEIIAKLKKLEVTISTSRKTFRLGKFIDMLQGAIKGYYVGDPVLRTCIMIARLCRTIYFFYDMLNWATRVTLVTGSSKEWARRAAPFWLVAVLVSLLRDLYEIVTYLRKVSAKKENAESVTALQYRPDLVVDTVKNVCDLPIPLNLMGSLDISQGTVGLLGLISSTCGLLAIASPSHKLTPM